MRLDLDLSTLQPCRLYVNKGTKRITRLTDLAIEFLVLPHITLAAMVASPRKLDHDLEAPCHRANGTHFDHPVSNVRGAETAD